MRSKPESIELYAQRCERLADAASNRQAKATFQLLAIQWRELAQTLRLLDQDAKLASEFFNNRSFAVVDGTTMIANWPDVPGSTCMPPR
jgi:hypothetical protein